jgi:hypothetical protein
VQQHLAGCEYRQDLARWMHPSDPAKEHRTLRKQWQAVSATTTASVGTNFWPMLVINMATSALMSTVAGWEDSEDL